MPCSGFRFIVVVSGSTTAKFFTKVYANLDAVKVAMYSPERDFLSSQLPFRALLPSFQVGNNE